MKNRNRRGRLAAVAGAAAAALVLTTAGSAGAETIRVFDKVGDGIRHAGDPPKSRHGDIQRFRVDHNLRKIRFRLFASKGGNFQEFTDVWVDTDPANRGPERLITFSAEVEEFSVVRVDRFFNTNNPKKGDTQGEVCGNDYRWGIRTIDATIPRACFGFAKRIRVSVQTAAEGHEVRRDWAPGPREFSRWVARG